MTNVEAWQCPSCKTPVTTAFCAHCGERRIKPQDLTLRGVFERLLHAMTSIDGRLLRTFGQLLRQPGTLTVAYMDGMRKPFASPFQVFLLANVLFFAVQSLTRSSIFGTPLESHLHVQDWSEFAQALLDRRLQRTHTTLAAYTPVFDRAVVLNAKALVILMTLPFACLLPLAFFGTRRPFMAHLVFALHLYAFLLLLFSVAVLIAGAHVLAGGAGLQSPVVDNVLSLVNVAACAVYLYLAMGPAYGARGAWAAVRAALLTIAAAAIVLGYRFAVFVITLYGT